MSKAEEGDNDNGDDVIRVPVPHVTVTFDPRTWSVAISGSTPSWEFTEAILTMALRETERKINERRIQRGLAIAGPELLENLKGSRKNG